MSDDIAVPLIPDCSACIISSLKTLIPLLTQDKEKQYSLFNLAYQRISEGYAKNLTPILLSVTLYQEIYEREGIENPYKEIKQRSKDAALKALLIIEKKIDQFQQRERFQARLDEPDKNWKFSMEDLEKRKLWDEYMAAFNEMLEKTTTNYAPWYVIPSDQKWYRNLAITRILVQTLEKLNPQYPSPGVDLSGVLIE